MTMRLWSKVQSCVTAVVLTGLCGLPFAEQAYTGQAAPGIAITTVPPKGGRPARLETIAGAATGVVFSECKVVLFARTDAWYVQPYANAPDTPLDAAGHWQNESHLGVEYAALLVKTTFKAPAKTATLPEIGGDVLAVARNEARAEAGQRPTSTSAARTLQFSGYEWLVKASDRAVGPGPNHFSASSENVAVDEQGRLHLRLTQRAGQWYCAEVISKRSFGYGTYKFLLDSVVDELDPRLVLGLFTWSDAPNYHHREIDVEISRWGQAGNKNGQFVVQPYTQRQNIVRFQIPSGLAATTHLFTWQPERIFCQSLTGHGTAKPTKDEIIYTHTFSQGIPQSGDENARINLWLIDGLPPTNHQEAEIIISKFEFLP